MTDDRALRLAHDEIDRLRAQNARLTDEMDEIASELGMSKRRGLCRLAKGDRWTQ